MSKTTKKIFKKPKAAGYWMQQMSFADNMKIIRKKGKEFGYSYTKFYKWIRTKVYQGEMK